MTDKFGWRPAISGVIGAGLHNGQDYAATSGTLIRAAAAGIVTYRGWDATGGGWMLRIDHGGGYQTLYLHMRENSPLVWQGQRVGVGLGIGYVGSTGASTGPHLHFMLERNGAYVDPVPYLKTSPAKPSPAKPKGTQMTAHVVRHDHKARNGGRSLKPGDAFYLHNDPKAGTANAANIAGPAGYYSFTEHVYAEGTPGDEVIVALIWQTNPGKKDQTNSPHYQQTVVIPASGKVRTNFDFKRYVGQKGKSVAVYANMTAPKTNKGNVKVTLFDSDAYVFV